MRGKGCYNKEIAEGFWVNLGWKILSYNVDGTRNMVMQQEWIPHRMSTTCQYDRRNLDSSCAGCLRNSVEAKMKIRIELK